LTCGVFADEAMLTHRSMYLSDCQAVRAHHSALQHLTARALGIRKEILADVGVGW